MTGLVSWGFLCFFRWFGNWRTNRANAKRRTELIIASLTGLPVEAKAELINQYFQLSQTFRGNPSSPTIRLLIAQGIVYDTGVGGGTYDAVNRYLAINPDVWEKMTMWFVMDGGAKALIMARGKPTEETS